ncbi:putative zinc metalloprotease [Corynebacterium glutamicum MB001]|uniref:Zinc metalloprotease Rip1 n=1 Tax=Corynebacterium glutamicum (strain ATCC 13032 / DSM 20300 / JCM 1318 / BCRC 11384 / CCUG 27702 / LMG 3730 / NBRC 12168 / NCIMB 10025 / NRRL B-2784 / 534) TaxID=196627 RepID=Q8NP11_CORGL|nr:M50 family metallopeptidase [Corynebacterium glutamicum]AGT05754.1 putative zinc metalloprotease [Corynebacterium glutamicum MB001]ARV63928.1 signaling protein [Corynebacterium glutamicum]ASW14404.1 putative zinc metalloprotease [Corynebacterium glutamicum]AUI01482.1 signaling protein [Corynebacterium glutamicum]AUI05130.1 signaling protein [Corynebacterium glutamicum]
MAAYLLGVVLFFLGIAVTIALHEWGHFITARIFGMKVRRFFIGFGPTVFAKRRGETVYGLKAIPVGGFCDIAGMTAQDELDPEDLPRAMYLKPWWQRIIVLSGGVIMNLIVGFLVLYGVAVSSGIPNPDVDTTATVDTVQCVPETQISATELSSCVGSGPAGDAGIEHGDKILAVNGQEMASFTAIRDAILELPGETATLTIEREGTLFDVDLQVASVTRLASDGSEITVGAVGMSSLPPTDVYKKYGPIEGVGATARFTGDMISATWDGLKAFPAKIPGVVASIFGAERDVESPMSVVGASRIGGEFVERSMWDMFMMMLASLNFFLALFNLVPLPPLDGGHIAVVIYEKIRDFFRKLRGKPAGGPADYTKLMPVTVAVAALLMTVGGLVIVADVVNPIRLFG